MDKQPKRQPKQGDDTTCTAGLPSSVTARSGWDIRMLKSGYAARPRGIFTVFVISNKAGSYARININNVSARERLIQSPRTLRDIWKSSHVPTLPKHPRALGRRCESAGREFRIFHETSKTSRCCTAERGLRKRTRLGSRATTGCPIVRLRILAVSKRRKNALRLVAVLKFTYTYATYTGRSAPPTYG